MSRYYRAKILMLKGEKGETGYSISNIQMNDDYTLTITIENGMQFNTPPIRGEKGERGACIRSAELRDDYSLLFTLDNGETIETTAILGKEFENIRALEASATSASKIATSASTSASASAQSATNASQSATSAQESASSASTSADTATSKATEASASATKAKESETNAKSSETNASNSAKEANTSATNAKASETKAKEYADNLQASTDDISKLKEDLVVNSKEDTKTKRSLSALWDLNKGISYRFEEDTTKAYQKQIPSGAKLYAVNKIGGKTIVYNQLFTEQSKIGNNGVICTYVDNVIILNGTSTEKWFNFSPLSEKLDVVGKFYIKMTILKNDDNISFYYGFLNRDVSTYTISSGSISVIRNQTEDYLRKQNQTGIAGFDVGTKFNDVKVKIMIVNLTQMFGSGNEPSTPREFEAMFPNDYYPYNEGTLMSMSVNDVVYTDTSNNQNSCQIPQAILDLDGYGWGVNNVYNYVDYENKKFHKYVNRVDLGTFNFYYTTFGNDNQFYIFRSSLPNDIKKQKDAQQYTNNLLCSKYTDTPWATVWLKGTDKIITQTSSINIADSSFTEAEAFKQSLQGVYLYYELAEPVVTDISDIIGDTFQEPFNVENGGSLTFKNTNGDGYQLAVPSDIQYVVSLSEVNS